MTANEKLLRKMFECHGKSPRLKILFLKAEYYKTKILNVPEGVIKIQDRFMFNGRYMEDNTYFPAVTEVIILPEGLAEIEENAFRDLHNIKMIYIPKTVEIIGNEAFLGFGGTIYCEDEPKSGWLNGKAETELHICQGGTVYYETVRSHNKWNPDNRPVITGVSREEFLKLIDEENF